MFQIFAQCFILFVFLHWMKGSIEPANHIIWWCHNSISETWTAFCGRQASFKALPPSIFAWIWRLRCHKAFPRSHLRLIWLLSMSQCHILIWLLSDRFTGLVGMYATNKCKERSSFLLKRERLVKTDIWGKWSCCSHTVWSCSHGFLFIRSDKKMESSLSILEILLSCESLKGNLCGEHNQVLIEESRRSYQYSVLSCYSLEVVLLI